MRKISIGLVFVLAAASLFAESEALKLFDYDPSMMNGGTMYTYKVSTFEGENEMLFYLYLAGDNKVEFYKDYSVFGSNIFAGKFELHKEYFIAAPLEGGNPLGELGIPNSNKSSEAEYLFEEKKIIMGSHSWNEDGELEYASFEFDVPMWPSYEISLWMLDFGLAMRHFKGSKEDKFRITCSGAGKTWQSNVSFEKEEEVNGILCDKWVVKGRGILAWMLGLKQELWFSKESPYYHVVQYKNHKFGGYWDKQKYVLQEITEMSYEEWEKHKAELTAQAKEKFGY